jgi:DNA-binding MarR family transcriptional regulator
MWAGSGGQIMRTASYNDAIFSDPMADLNMPRGNAIPCPRPGSAAPAAESTPAAEATPAADGPAGFLPIDGAGGAVRDDGPTPWVDTAAQVPARDLESLDRLAGLDHGVLAALAGSDQAAGIARQVADMAQGLAALADRLVGQNMATPASAGGVLESDCVAFLEGQFRIRRLRARHLQGLSLGEPAWDILLDLAVAHYWRRETSVTSLCIAADVPSTTALRWINGMTKAGLIVRRPCLRDGRRSFLAIAPATYQAMLALAADSLRSVEKLRVRYQRNAA